MQAPCDTIDRFPLVQTDTFKAQSANMLELDWGIGNVTASYQAAGIWQDTVFILVRMQSSIDPCEVLPDL